MAISEDLVIQKMLECKGDLFATAYSLGMDVSDLATAITRIPELSLFRSIISSLKDNNDFYRVNTEVMATKISFIIKAMQSSALTKIQEIMSLDIREQGYVDPDVTKIVLDAAKFLLTHTDKGLTVNNTTNNLTVMSADLQKALQAQYKSGDSGNENSMELVVSEYSPLTDKG